MTKTMTETKIKTETMTESMTKTMTETKIKTETMTEPEEEKVKATIRKLAAESSLEVTPRGAEKVESFAELLRLDGVATSGKENLKTSSKVSSKASSHKPRVFITFLPGSDLAETTKTAIRLAREGISPIPHIAARSLTSSAMLEDALKAWVNEAAVEEVLLIGGATPRPLGPFASSLDVLHLGLLERHAIRAIGFAGHPEGSPDISPAACLQALVEKERYIKGLQDKGLQDKGLQALRNSIKGYIVTQFCFESVPIFEYLPTVPLPTYIGLPGLATLKTLIMHAQQCGIGNSMRLLLKRAKDVTQLLATRAPDKLLREIAQKLSDEQTDNPAGNQSGNPAGNQTFAEKLGGIHLYPLGGIRKTAQWRKAVAEGKFQLQEEGFSVNP